ncbi:hypothetical protein L1987_74452 [Smallanthus sonchifolius]|uniref:Uncharacterized protein n=1 Tax=Smallanthus sonchifolius TaxID=185202 RepID=A0ACB9A3D6_9ASTR|nr:hypothetical protein L1987_74452 [Smallanthus sonchifolius]
MKNLCSSKSDAYSVLTSMDDGEVKRSKRLTCNSSNTLRVPSNLEGSHVQDSLKNRRTGDQTDHGPDARANEKSNKTLRTITENIKANKERKGLCGGKRVV